MNLLQQDAKYGTVECGTCIRWRSIHAVSNSGGAAARPRRPPPCGDLRRLSDEWMSMGNHLLMVNFCQPSHEFTFNVDIDLLF
jgi:hypothetical protein